MCSSAASQLVEFAMIKTTNISKMHGSANMQSPLLYVLLYLLGKIVT